MIEKNNNFAKAVKDIFENEGEKGAIDFLYARGAESDLEINEYLIDRLGLDVDVIQLETDEVIEREQSKSETRRIDLMKLMKEEESITEKKPGFIRRIFGK